MEVPLGWGYLLIRQRSKLSIHGGYFRRRFPFLMTTCTTGVSAAEVPGVSLIVRAGEICRSGHLKPAVFKVLPGRVIKLTILLRAM